MNLESNLSGTDYSALIAANPYRNQTYNKTGWQKFLSWLGFRTEADAWEENMSVQAAEYDAALAQKQFDTQYETANNQVSRLREAGLNPDLNAGSVDAGGAAPMGEDPSTPMQSTGASGTFEELAGFVFQAVSAGVAISKDIFSLDQLRLSNREKKVGIADQIVDLAFNTAVGAYPSRPSSDPVNGAAQLNQAFELANETVGSMLPKSLRKRFKQNVSRFMSSLPAETEAYKMLGERASSRTDYFRQRGSQYYSESDDVMEVINEELISLADQLAKKSASNAVQSADVQAQALERQGEYLESADGALEGQAQNARNSLDIQQNVMSKEINSTMSKIVHRLAEQANNGNVLAEGVLLIFNVLRLKSLNVSSGDRGSSFGLSF